MIRQTRRRCNLRNDNVKLYGRKQELKELREAVGLASSERGEAQLVLVRGASGTGKSRLVEHAFRDYKLFGVGKLSEGATCSALWYCMGTICQQLILLKQDMSELKKVLDADELQLLCTIIPNFRELACMEPQKSDPASVFNNNTKKLEYAVRELLKSVSSPGRPVILALNDLQWIDAATFELFKSLLVEQRHVVVVGSYRDNELDDHHVITPWIEQVTKADFANNTTIVTAGDLSLESIEMLLDDMFRCPEEGGMHELALLLQTRTHGNIFYVLQLLDYWQAAGLLTYNVSSGIWIWDMLELKSKTSLTANALDVILAKMYRLPQNVLSKLNVFACLGYKFDGSVLDLLPSSEADVDSIGLQEALQVVLDRGLLERLGQNHIQFAHDKIYEAACKLLPTGAQQLNFNIALQLWKNQATSSDDKHLFLCADQFLSAGELIQGKDFKLNVAHVQLRAAKRAASFSAFLPAVRYASASIELLDPATCWDSDTYYLTLEVYTVLSEYSSYTGQLEKHKMAVEEVLRNAKSIHDKTRAKLAYIQGLIAEAKFKDVLSVSLDFLKQLGVDVPAAPSSWYTKRVMDKVKGKLNGKVSKEALLAMPEADDFSKSTAIQVMSDAVTSALQLGMHNLMTVLVSRIILVTLEHGVAPYSAIGFAMSAQLFVTLRMDLDLASELSEIALALSDSGCKCRAGAMLYSYNNFHWRQQLGKVNDGYLETYRTGMRNGDLHTAFQSVVAYSFTYFYSGLPLGPLLSDLTKFNNLMMEYGHKFFLLINVPIHQCVLNLTGKSNDILDLYGGVAAFYREKVGWESRAGEQVQWSYALQLAVYCECLDLATEMYETLEPLPPGVSKSVVFYPTRIFFFAVIAIWNFKSNGKRKWKHAARKHMATIKGWVAKNGAINLAHKVLILEAEEASMKKNVSEQELVALYDKAINVSAKTGFLQDAGLASHLASRSVTDGRSSRDYFRRCIDHYVRWGAKGIPSFLTRENANLPSSLMLPRVESARQNGFRARERFDMEVIEEHKNVSS